MVVNCFAIEYFSISSFDDYNFKKLEIREMIDSSDELEF
jgi:hypothetical protein